MRTKRMGIQILRLFAKQVWQNTIKNKGTPALFAAFNMMLIMALVAGFINLKNQQSLTDKYGLEVRENWESNPDKHPHRMAHYGYVAFRQRFPLSFFDFGMDSYLGNAVFLEAHKQNTVNFSEVSLSNGLLRFGEFSAALILLVLLPLLLFFWGFDLVSRERENGTLRILLTQGITWKELLFGKAIGLFALSQLVFLPAVLMSMILLIVRGAGSLAPQAFGQLALVVLSYLIYYFILSLLAVFISAKSRSSKSSLTTLIGLWLAFTLVLPKLAQVAGQQMYPTPTKVEFDTAVEEELVKQGDSHNPNDPHYAALKDSLLTAYGVESTQDLPFNYSGFMMKEGERLSAEVWQRHQDNLIQIYQQQQNIVRLSSLVNPYIGVKNISMTMSGTSYAAYHDFQRQAEDFRYMLAQTMNQLQIENISNKVSSSADKDAVLSHEHWEEFPDFEQRFLPFNQALKNEWLPLITLLVWLGVLVVLINTSIKKLNVI